MSYRVEELCEVDHFQEQMTTMLEKTIGKVSPFSLKLNLLLCSPAKLRHEAKSQNISPPKLQKLSCL